MPLGLAVALRYSSNLRPNFIRTPFAFFLVIARHIIKSFVFACFKDSHDPVFQKYLKTKTMPNKQDLKIVNKRMSEWQLVRRVFLNLPF